MLSRKAKERLTIFIFLAPWIILFAVFSIYPLAFSIIVSLSRYSGLNPHMEFVGISNYVKAFQDEVFLRALKNTFVFVVGTIPFTTAISLFMAILINDKLLPMREFFQAGFFLPSVVSMVVISLIWLYLYSADGPFNLFFAKWGTHLKASASLMQSHSIILWLI
ncbi:MAG: sugar ABC transporter permease, partial [Thermotogaceae bacterium]|nr:sugar ABC transporter permease [Thermotogaceae bacterium]